jgi:leucyl/phenylalanyl-tRNA--protein transferase
MIFEVTGNKLWFPDTALADADGLLAFGGDLSTERLLYAYSKGIFPWYSEDTPILWYSPHERFVLFPSEIRISKSMKQIIQSGKFEMRKDTAFEEVIRNCALAPREGQDGTWITNEMQEAYIELYKKGYAHSFESWHNNILVGGLYGVEAGRVFCGESMFSNASNASKAALAWLAGNFNYNLIDCQVHTSHLESMGAKMIPREEYEEIIMKNEE